jgi:hypothetical protein
MRKFAGASVLGFVLISLVMADDPPKVKEQTDKSEKDTHESVLKLMVKNRQATADLLAKVTDASSGKETKPKLEKLSEEVKDIQNRFNKLGTPDRAEEGKLRGMFERDVAAAVKKIEIEVVRLLETDYGPDVLKAVRPMPKVVVPPKKDKPPDKGPADK